NDDWHATCIWRARVALRRLDLPPHDRGRSQRPVERYTAPMQHRPQLIGIFRDIASEIAEKDLSFVHEDSAISDLGIDSLAMLELIGSMERTLRVRVPDEQLVGVSTVRQLLELVEGRMKQVA